MIAAAMSADAQWTMQQSHATASLRGIHNVGGGVVWASGTEGTILHTTDDGENWQPCAVPPGAEKLDFRGIQAFDANTAVVMSSGTGNLSRIYKTNDGCRKWKLVFSNPDASGFWDAMRFSSPRFGVLIGDQVGGLFPVFVSSDAGDSWRRLGPAPFSPVDKNQSFFAASNTSLVLDEREKRFYMITGGGTTSLITVDPHFKVSHTQLDMAKGETAGGFSLASRMDGSNLMMVAVGGDYKKPEERMGTASFSNNGKWHISDTPPNGYRSAVAYDSRARTWIAVGPNGTDISADDGRNWRALKPGANETRDVDKNWNALSLPFVVGPNGRIGKLAPR